MVYKRNWEIVERDGENDYLKKWKESIKIKKCWKVKIKIGHFFKWKSSGYLKNKNKKKYKKGEKYVKEWGK